MNKHKSKTAILHVIGFVGWVVVWFYALLAFVTPCWFVGEMDTKIHLRPVGMWQNPYGNFFSGWPKLYRHAPTILTPKLFSKKWRFILHSPHFMVLLQHEIKQAIHGDGRGTFSPYKRRMFWNSRGDDKRALSLLRGYDARRSGDLLEISRNAARGAPF